MVSWFDKLFPPRRREPLFRIPLIRTLVGKFRRSRVNPSAVPSSSRNQDRENWIDSTTTIPILPLHQFPFSPDSHLHQFNTREDARFYTQNPIKETEEKKTKKMTTTTTTLVNKGSKSQNLQTLSCSSSSSSSVADCSFSSSSSLSTSTFFVHETESTKSEGGRETTIDNQIQNEEEITTYLSHLDEPTTIIVINNNNNNELTPDDNNNNNTILPLPEIEILHEQKTLEIENELLILDPVVQTSTKTKLKTFPPDQNEKSGAKSVVAGSVKREGKVIKDGRVGKLENKMAWDNIDTILKHFGHTFLERVSHALTLLNFIPNRRLARKLSRSDVLDMLTQPTNGRPAPKIIVMIDDPPKASLEKNRTLGRLLCVKLYLLKVQFFVIPCLDLSIPVLHSMINRLIEDKSSKCQNFKMAYNFILQMGFSTLLKRNDANVIVFDGDWNNYDVCGLIKDAEKSGHELVFMKNHQGIKRRAFVNLVISRIQTKLHEFAELKTTESRTSAYTPNSATSETSCSRQNHNEQETTTATQRTVSPTRLDVLRQYNSGIIRLSHAHTEHDESIVNQKRKQETTAAERENYYARLQPYYAFMKLDLENTSEIPIVGSRKTRKQGEETPVETFNESEDQTVAGACEKNRESESHASDCQIQLLVNEAKSRQRRKIRGVRRTQSWS